MSICFLYFSTFFIYIKKNITFFFSTVRFWTTNKISFLFAQNIRLCSFCFVYQFLYSKQYVFFCSAVLDYCTGFTNFFFFWFELTVLEYRTAAL